MLVPSFTPSISPNSPPPMVLDATVVPVTTDRLRLLLFLEARTDDQLTALRLHLHVVCTVYGTLAAKSCSQSSVKATAP